MSIAMPMAMPRIRRQPQPPTKIGSIMLSHIHLLDLTAMDEPIGTPMDLPATILGNPYIAQVRLTKVQAVPGLVTSLEWQQALLQELDGCAKVMRQLGQTTYTSSWDIHDGRQQYLFAISLVPNPPDTGNDTGNPDQPNTSNDDTVVTLQDPQGSGAALTITPDQPGNDTAANPVRTQRPLPPSPPRPLSPRAVQPQRITPRQ